MFVLCTFIVHSILAKVSKHFIIGDLLSNAYRGRSGEIVAIFTENLPDFTRRPI